MDCPGELAEPQDVSFQVPFGSLPCSLVMYDIDVRAITGGCNRLHLFDLDSVDDTGGGK